MAEIAGLMTVSEAIQLCGLRDAVALTDPFHETRSGAIHHATHLMDLGRLKPDSPDVASEIKGCLESYDRWKHEHLVTVLKREEHVIHLDPRFQGMLDWLGYVDGGLFVIDIKLSLECEEDWHRYHTALYALAWKVTNPGKPMPRRAALYLDPDGGHPNFREHKDRIDLERAKAIVTVAHILRMQARKGDSKAQVGAHPHTSAPEVRPEV